MVCNLTAALVLNHTVSFPYFTDAKQDLLVKQAEETMAHTSTLQYAWSEKKEVSLQGKGLIIEFYPRLMIFSAVFNSLAIDTLRFSLHARINLSILLLMRFWKDVVVNSIRLQEIKKIHFEFPLQTDQRRKGRDVYRHNLSYTVRDQVQNS